MNMRLWLGLAGMAALGASSVGCGDDDGGGGGGVSGGKQVSDLTETEQISLCKQQAKNTVALTKASYELECTATALQDADSCEDTRDACIASTDDISAEDFSAECEDNGGDDTFQNCDATVSQVNACINAWVKKVQAISGDLSCETTEDDINDIDFSRPSACDAIADDCPEVADLIEFEE